MTKMIRRRLAMAGTLVAPMLARHGWAQSAYTNKQIRMVVPFAPAGTSRIASCRSENVDLPGAANVRHTISPALAIPSRTSARSKFVCPMNCAAYAVAGLP